MPGLPNSALSEHVQRYETRSDNESDTSSDAPETGTIHRRVREDQSFLSLVFADTAARRNSAVNALARWWQEQQPVIIELIRQYRTLVVDFLAPLTPRAARRAGFHRASHEVLRLLDSLDAKLPGGERGWSQRWRRRSRPGNREAPLAWLPFSIEGTVGGVGVAAAVVLLTAVSWCSWRRSSTSWSALFVEMACGSAWAANIIARKDGLREAKLLESRLAALERSLGSFFRGVQACSRMVRCSQALSFGLRLSVPMPPVARMEGGTSATVSGAVVTLRDVRLVLSDVVEGGIEQTQAFGAKKPDSNTSTSIRLEDTDQVSDSGKGHSPRLLAGIVRSEKQLIADLRRFIAEVAERINQAMMMGSDVWGFWWDSELEDTSDAVRGLAEYFEAAAHRLEITIGPRGMVFPTCHKPGSKGDIAAAAEALSALRLQYEEAVVRLYSCQNNVTSMLCDQENNRADGWNAVRQGLAQARAAIEPSVGHGDHELWEKLERMVDCFSRDCGVASEAELTSGESPSPDTSEDTSRHLEAGAGWVSLRTPTEQEPRVFEGGCVDPSSEETVEPLPPKPAVTDVLVGVSSLGRSQSDREHCRVADVDGGELLDERSRSQLVGELDSVLRARPLPPTNEKHLPLEGQDLLKDYDEEEVLHEGDALDGSSYSDKPIPPLEPHVVHISPSGGTSNQDLMSELKAQLSMAVNEEIFSSDQADRHAVTVVPRVSQEGNVLENLGENLSNVKH